jgi:hypothetical protein
MSKGQVTRDSLGVYGAGIKSRAVGVTVPCPL